MNSSARFATYMVVAVLLALAAFVTVFLTGAMLIVGLWDAAIPLAVKITGAVLGPALLWLEFYAYSRLLDWSTEP